MVRWKVEIIPEECHSGEWSGFRRERLRPARVKDNIGLNPRINVPSREKREHKGSKVLRNTAGICFPNEDVDPELDGRGGRPSCG